MLSFGPRQSGWRYLIRPLLFALGVCLAVLIVSQVAPARAADVATLQARVDAAHTEARTLAAAVQMRGAELAGAAHEANVAAQRQRVLEGELARGAARAQVLEAAVTAAQERLLAAQARLHRGQARLARRLVAIYKSDSPDLTTVLLESDGFGDLLTRAAYLQEINAADQGLLARVRTLRDQVHAALTRTRAARERAAAEVARLAAARDGIARIRASAQVRAAQLSRARAAAQSALVALRSRISGWTEQVRRLQAATAGPGNAGQTVEQWFDGFTIPKTIVQCESGGNYNALNPSSGAGGAYQLLPETYKGLGGTYSAPNAAPKWEQDKLAAKLWNGGQGRGNWEC